VKYGKIPKIPLLILLGLAWWLLQYFLWSHRLLKQKKAPIGRLFCA
jgi:hypothetical protein